jgi:hypothetical protein
MTGPASRSWFGPSKINIGGPLHVLTNWAAGRTPLIFLRLIFFTREETGCAILTRHFSWGQKPWQEPAADPSHGWAPTSPVSTK